MMIINLMMTKISHSDQYFCNEQCKFVLRRFNTTAKFSTMKSTNKAFQIIRRIELKQEFLGTVSVESSPWCYCRQNIPTEVEQWNPEDKIRCVGLKISRSNTNVTVQQALIKRNGTVQFKDWNRIKKLWWSLLWKTAILATACCSLVRFYAVVACYTVLVLFIKIWW